MRTLATSLLLVAMLAFTLPQAVSQEKGETAAQERREHAVQRDVPADLQRARQALQNAMQELSASGNQWGGHRVAAMGHVRQALQEIQKAETYARQHKLAK